MGRSTAKRLGVLAANNRLGNSASAIVIGAGVAGMATSIRLAVMGFKVDVYEKNSYAGGKIASFNLGNYQFDEGPSLFTLPGLVEELFGLADKNIEDYLHYSRLPVSCKYFYENGKVVNAYADPEAFARELSNVVSEDEQQVLAYLNRSATVYNNIGSIFLSHSLHSTSFLKAPIGKALKATSVSLLLNSLHHYNSAWFKSPEAVQLFDRFATYNGSNPFTAPAMLSMIPHLEQNLGAYYPQGGMISISNALYKLAVDVGVQFHFNVAVEKIVVQNRKATAVQVQGNEVKADVVISNADVYFTYKNLLGDDKAAIKLLKQERSSSAIVFYWGVKKVFPHLSLHNIFFSTDYKQEFDCIFKTNTISADPTVYVNITSKMESHHAPEGCENWFVMVNVPADTGQNWIVLRQQLKGIVINKLNRLLNTDLNGLIAEEHVMDPVNIEQKTSSYMGSLYGTSSNGKLAAFLRHPNFSSKINGLYFAGGSVHPGGGIPLCLQSAKLVSNLIRQKMSNKK